MTPNPPDTHTICSRCVRRLPFSEFRRQRRNSDVRHTYCRQCHTAIERERKQKHRNREKGIIAGKYSSQIATSRKFERTSNLLDEMVRHLGGVNQFLAFWSAEIDRVQKQKRTTCRALRFCELIIAADLAANRRKPAAVENTADDTRDAVVGAVVDAVAGDTPKETAEYVRERAQEALRLLFVNEPSLVSKAARQAGVTLVWYHDIHVPAP